jgi:arylsulfatase A-like enzyme
MAEWLQGLGYRTICATTNGLVCRETGLARGFSKYGYRMAIEKGIRRQLARVKRSLIGGDSGGHVLNRWIHGEVGGLDGPMFLYVNYMDCHWSYVPSRRAIAQVGGSELGVAAGLRYRMGTARRSGTWEAISRSDEKTLRAYSRLYEAELAAADSHLRELLNLLQVHGRGRPGQTVLLVTSDHGEHIGEHGLADHHASLDDHLLNVPFVAWGPDLIPTGVNRSVSEHVDVLPSLAALLGEEPPTAYSMRRRSQLFELEAIDTPDSGYALASWRSWSRQELSTLEAKNPSFDFRALAHDLISVRDSNFRMTRSSDGTETMWDMGSDSSCDHGVSAAQFPEASRLRQHLEDAKRAWSGTDAEPASLGEKEQLEIERRLEALGYI